MSDDWQPLRAYLERWVTAQIALEPDPADRALLRRHHAYIVDQIEINTLRRRLAEREQRAPDRTLH